MSLKSIFSCADIGPLYLAQRGIECKEILSKCALVILHITVCLLMDYIFLVIIKPYNAS